jgi:hypothetical protein
LDKKAGREKYLGFISLLLGMDVLKAITRRLDNVFELRHSGFGA